MSPQSERIARMLMPAWPHGDPREVARSILADPRFVARPPAPAAGRWWLDDVRDWIARLLRGIFHTLDRALGSGNALDTAIGFAVIAAAFALAGYGVYLLVRSLGRRNNARVVSGSFELLSPAEQRASVLRAAARDAARAGRFRDAAALLFGAAIRALDEGGRLAFDPARTPGEYRRLVRDPVFDSLAADAVVAVFASAEPRAELFERMSQAYDCFFEVSAA